MSENDCDCVHCDEPGNAMHRLQATVARLTAELEEAKARIREERDNRDYVAKERDSARTAVAAELLGLEHGKQEAVRRWQEALATAERLTRERSCPCLLTTPCHERCTCINPLSSSGCRRCCAYGSVEQRTAMAVRIAGLIDAASQEGKP